MPLAGPAGPRFLVHQDNCWERRRGWHNTVVGSCGDNAAKRLHENNADLHHPRSTARGHLIKVSTNLDDLLLCFFGELCIKSYFFRPRRYSEESQEWSVTPIARGHQPAEWLQHRMWMNSEHTALRALVFVSWMSFSHMADLCAEVTFLVTRKANSSFDLYRPRQQQSEKSQNLTANVGYSAPC